MFYNFTIFYPVKIGRIVIAIGPSRWNPLKHSLMSSSPIKIHYNKIVLCKHKFYSSMNVRKGGKAKKSLFSICLNPPSPGPAIYLSAAVKLCLLKISSIADLTSTLSSSTRLNFIDTVNKI